jgi:oxygen-independent coproporphyrinogen-3 oxidase
VSRGGREARRRFTAALVAEIASVRVAPGARFDTVYLGGGTPSLLEPELLERILAAANAALPLVRGAFVVLEANPEDVEPATLDAWRALGVGGVSIGVQSFDDDVLKRLGRRHRGAAGRRAVALALDAGFEWVSLDLIYGAPGAGTPASDLEAALALGPHHLSCYQLTVHPGTPFGRARDRGRLCELAADDQAALFLDLHRTLAAGGYQAYEVSNFARGREHRSRHNAKYWRHAPYLGVGPSAHSFDGRSRWWNLRDWRRWASAVEEGSAPVEAGETLGRDQLALEAVMLGMRTADGIDIDGYRARYGVDLLAANAEWVERAASEGLVAVEAGRLRPTVRGLAVADALAAALEIGPAGRI